MADVFISYAREDHTLAQSLARELDNSGVSVFWAENLVTGERFRDRLAAELRIARLVVVLWSHYSISSDYVKAEAEQARITGRLAPFRTPQLSIGDLPIPFAEFDTPHLSSPSEFVRIVIMALDRRSDGNPALEKTLNYSATGYISPDTAEPAVACFENDNLSDLQHRRAIPQKTDGHVVFKMAEPADLHPVSVVAQCLDNQWAPRSVQEKQRQKRLSLTDVTNDRRPAMRREFLRSLLTARQVVINRAFLYSNPAIVECYDEEEEISPFSELLSSGAIVPFLFDEASPTDPPAFDTLAFARWKHMAENADLTCLRLDWGEGNAQQVALMSELFHRYVRDMDRLNVSAVAERFGIDLSAKSNRIRLEQALKEVSDFAREKSQGECVSRTELYERFVIPENDLPSHGRIDAGKNFSLEIKQLLDLKYNLNLPDYLDRFSLTPMDSLPRQALQEIELMVQRAQFVEPVELLRVTRAINFERAVRSVSLPNLDQVSLDQIVQTRRSIAFETYLDVARKTLPDQTRPEDQIVFQNPEFALEDITHAYRNVWEDLQSRTYSDRRDVPFVVTLEIQITGTSARASIFTDVNSNDVRIHVPDEFGQLANRSAPIGVELRISGSSMSDFRLPLARMKTGSAREFWREFLDGLQEDVRRGRYVPGNWSSQVRDSADVAGFEQKDADD